jgi:hypothetical protein
MPVDYRKALEQIKQSQNQAAQLAAVAGGK